MVRESPRTSTTTVGPSTTTPYNMSDDTMPAGVLTRYSKTGLAIAQRPVPTAASLGPRDVVVGVHVVSLNPADYKMRRGEVKVFRGKKPTSRNPVTIGFDFAGMITAVSSSTEESAVEHNFRVGDRVFGLAPNGALAPFAVVNVASLAKIPDGVQMGEAAALVTAGVTALQMLAHAGVSTEENECTRLMVTGGAGGVGHLALQMAKSVFKVEEVATTASKEKIEFVKTCGADIVVDYKTENFAKVLSGFDVALDCTGETSKCKRIVTKDGKGVVVGILGIPDGTLIGKVIDLYQMPHFYHVVVPFLNCASWFRRFASVRVVQIVSLPYESELSKLGGYCADGLLKPTIDRVYTLQHVAEAFDYAEQGHVVGKVLVEVVPQSTAGLKQRCPL